MPLRKQRLRVGCHVQRHIRPEHLHAAFGRLLKARSPAGPTRCAPPRYRQWLGDVRLSLGRGFGDKALRIGIALAQQGVCFYATAHSIPMAPRSGGGANPLQTRLHAPRDFLVQPRRRCRRGRLPARGAVGVAAFGQDHG